MIWIKIILLGIYVTTSTTSIYVPNNFDRIPQGHLSPPPPPPPPPQSLSLQRLPKTLPYHENIEINYNIPPQQLIPPTPQHEVYNIQNPHPSITQLTPQTNESTFMQRVAKWFGFGNTNNSITNDQQPQQSISSNVNIQERHILSQSSTDTSNIKPNGCYPCNKIPWIPMHGLNGNSEYRQTNIVNTNNNNNNNNYKQNIQRIPEITRQQNTNYYNIRQSDIKHLPKRLISQPLKYSYITNNNFPKYNTKIFNNNQQKYQPLVPPQYNSNHYPHHHQQQQQQPHKLTQQLLPNQFSPQNAFRKPLYTPSLHLIPIDQVKSNVAPIPVPNLSVSPIPPLYNAKPFLIGSYLSPQNGNYNIPPVLNEQNSHNYQHQHFQNNNYHQSKKSHQFNYNNNDNNNNNNKNNNQYPILPNSQGDFEIVKSVQVGEYTSSIEYPVNTEQNQIIHIEPNTEINTGTENYSSHVIQSQLPIITTTSPNEYISHPIIVQSYDKHFQDNYSAASAHNLTVRNEDNKIVGNYITVEYQPSTNNIDITEPTVFQSSTFSDVSAKTPSETIDGNNVEFQASIQTNLDTHKTIQSNKRDRDTPQHLLDSPILYQRNASTRNPSDLRVTKYPPHKSTYSDDTINYQHLQTSSTSYSSTNRPAFLINNKPGQRQIIIPYTINKNPSPFFKNKYENSNWDEAKPINDLQDIHDSQESQIITATIATTESTFTTTAHSESKDIFETTTSPLVTTISSSSPVSSNQFPKYVIKNTGSNLRELLKKEKQFDVKPFDIKKLRKNIDHWTEQEYSIQSLNNNNNNNSNNKASTVSLLIQSKIIPTEYLTTTPIPHDIIQLTTAQDANIPETTLTPYENLLSDEEFKKYEFIDKIIEDNHLNPESFAIAPKYQFGQTSTTTPFPQQTTSENYWNHAKISISPLTKEKIYVVTPLPRTENNNNNNNNNNNIGNGGDIGEFKSPRFRVRPTPGSSKIDLTKLQPYDGQSSNNRRLTLPEKINDLRIINEKLTTKLKPQLFGLMDTSVIPVQTVHGHSKVFSSSSSTESASYKSNQKR